MSRTDQTWLPLRLAAAQLNVHPTTLRRWADNGDIPFLLTPGGHRRFSTDDIEEFASSRSQRRALVPVEQIWAEKALTLWTLKEAIVKARGQSVWDGLAGISLTIDGPHLVWESPPPDHGNWRLAVGPIGVSNVLAVALVVPDGDHLEEPLPDAIPPDSVKLGCDI